MAAPPLIPVSRPVLGDEELRGVAEVFGSGWLGLGATTRAFEAALEQYLGCRHAIAVNSGTAALHVALAGFGIGRGDEVIVPSLTFAACVQAILATGATPVFCEVDERTALVDVDDVGRRITPRTKAIMPVHFGGQACDLDALLALAERQHCWVIEDAAHAFGSTMRGRRLGSFGHAACFSFDPIKNLTCGEGGAVVLADDTVAASIRQRRNLGIDKDAWRRHGAGADWFYEVGSEGFRYHMPNFCAAIGLAQLPKLDGFLARRRAICRRYDEAFASLRAVRPLAVDYAATAPHLYVVRAVDRPRQDLMDFLTARGVGTAVHYLPNHRQPHFAPYASGALPVTERLCREILTLPLHCALGDADVERVVEAVVAWDRG